MTLRTVTVDDEPLARERLKFLLADETDIQIVAECRNGAEAVAYLQSQPVDLLFLDIQMPVMNGLEVVQQVGMFHLPPTVFITAYQEHALHAFEVNATDYLTKPIDPQRLKLALTRVRERIAAKTALLTQTQFSAMLQELADSAAQRKSSLTRLMVRDGSKDVLLSTNSIEWIEAADYYSSLHVQGRTFMLRETITELCRKLDPATFVRVHRSIIVNLDHVREIHREGPSEGSVVLISGQILRTSKAGRQKLSEIGQV
jgi:two-component system, LytTR family, response regulator